MATNRKHAPYNVELVIDDMALKGWRPTDLARETSLSDMTIGRFLKGQVQTAPTAKKIAKALGRGVRRYYIPRDQSSDTGPSQDRRVTERREADR